MPGKPIILKLFAILFLMSCFVFCQNDSVVADQPTMSMANNRLGGVRVWRGSFQQKVTEIPPRPNHVWRKTQDGWKQIPLDPLPFVHQFDLPQQRPKVHPFSIASLTLLLCLAAMAWASSEWEWQRFVGEE